MDDKTTEPLSIKITKAEKAALLRVAGKETIKSGKKTTITALMRRALAAIVKRAA